MRLDIAPFVAAEASADDMAAFYEVFRSSAAIDFPDLPPPELPSYAAELRKPLSMLGPRRLWAARSADRTVATATVIFPEPENRHLTITTIRVAPAERRQGIGTVFLRTLLPEMRQAGRRLVTGQGLKVGGAGERWSDALGFAKVQEFVLQDLLVAKVDPARWVVAPPAGFVLERWRDTAPESLLSGFAAARNGISDAPCGESSLEDPDWTAETVREEESEVRERGNEQWVVAAVHAGTGTVAGLTVIEMLGTRPEQGLQQDTVVVAEYRGLGLGRLMKSEMMRWLTSERAGVERISTNTAADNVHMIRVNHEVGYDTVESVADVEADVVATMERLG